MHFMSPTLLYALIQGATLFLDIVLITLVVLTIAHKEEVKKTKFTIKTRGLKKDLVIAPYIVYLK